MKLTTSLELVYIEKIFVFPSTNRQAPELTGNNKKGEKTETLRESGSPKIQWPGRCLDFLMFSNVTLENSVSLFRLLRNEKWRDTLGKQPGALTHSQGEEAGGEEEESESEFWQEATCPDGLAWTPIVQRRSSSDWRENTRALNPLSWSWTRSMTHKKLTKASPRFHWRLRSLRLLDSGAECVGLYRDELLWLLCPRERQYCIFHFLDLSQ